MTTGAIVVLGLVVQVLCFESQNADLLVLSSFLTLGYGLLLMRDQRTVSYFLSGSGMKGEGSTLTKRRSKPIQAVTTWGKEILSTLNAWCYQKSMREFEINTQTSSLKELREVLVDPSTHSGGVGDLEVFFERALVQISRYFRCAGSAIVFVSQRSSNLPNLSRFSEVRCVANGVSDLGVHWSLRHHFTPILLGEMEANGTRELSMLVDIRSHGLFESLQSCFTCDREQQGVRAVLWLGYNRGRPPWAIERQRLAEVSEVLRVETLKVLEIQGLCRRVEQAEQLHRDNTEALTHLSHDIRSPLNNITSVLQFLKLSQSDNDSVQIIDAALRNSESLGEVVSDLLDLSQHGTKNVSVRSETFNLIPLIKEVFSSYEVVARFKNLRMVVDLRANSAEIHADRSHIKRVLSNLISNAIKYTHSGVVKVSLDSSPDDTISVLVSDTGLGMTEDQLARLFVPFTRFHSQVSEGLGLGLSVTKLLVEINGGTLRVSSTPGSGSEFCLQFPRAYPSSLGEGGFVDKEELSPAVLSVLVADDDVPSAESLVRVIQSWGHQGRACYDVPELLKSLEQAPPDMIIADCNMPGGNIRSLLNAVAARNLSSNVIVMSGARQDQKQLKALGAVAVLEKPLDLNVLKNLIRNSRPLALGTAGY